MMMLEITTPTNTPTIVPTTAPTAGEEYDVSVVATIWEGSLPFEFSESCVAVVSLH